MRLNDKWKCISEDWHNWISKIQGSIKSAKLYSDLKLAFGSDSDGFVAQLNTVDNQDNDTAHGSISVTFDNGRVTNEQTSNADGSQNSDFTVSIRPTASQVTTSDNRTVEDAITAIEDEIGPETTAGTLRANEQKDLIGLYISMYNSTRTIHDVPITTVQIAYGMTRDGTDYPTTGYLSTLNVNPNTIAVKEVYNGGIQTQYLDVNNQTLQYSYDGTLTERKLFTYANLSTGFNFVYITNMQLDTGSYANVSGSYYSLPSNNRPITDSTMKLDCYGRLAYVNGNWMIIGSCSIKCTAENFGDINHQQTRITIEHADIDNDYIMLQFQDASGSNVGIYIPNDGARNVRMYTNIGFNN